jgi:hypothetical protein
MHTISEKALDSRARRAAGREGYVARKSRWRVATIDNYGGYMIVEPSRNCCIAGPRFELSAEDVIAWCEDLRKRD